MDKKQFRKAFKKARNIMLYGHASQELDFSPLERLAASFFLKMSQSYDPLAARCGGFATSARARLALYPLAARRG